MAVTFAFSVHTFIDKIGAYVAFAAALGLALMALLIFAQARELRRMREWGANAHDRIGDLERRLAAAMELARRAGSAAGRTVAPGARARPASPAAAAARAAQSRPVAAASTSSPVRLPLLPAAPAGVGGPAIASATAFVPLPAHPPGVAAPAAGAPADARPGGAEAPPAPAPAPAATREAAPPAGGRQGFAARPPSAVPATAAASAAEAVTAQPDPSAPAPATAAAQAPSAPATVVEPPAGGNGHRDEALDTLAPEALPPRPAAQAPDGPAAPARPAGAAPPRHPAARPPARPSGRPARSAAARPASAPLRARTPSAAPRTTTAPPGRRRFVVALAGLGVLAVAIVVAIVAMSGGGSSSPAHARSGTTAAQTHATAVKQPRKAAATTVAHGQITVAVLNGTPTPGLANTVANSLAAAGYQRGYIGNASDQQRSVTVVEYTGGNEPAALEVAKSLGVPSDGVQPIDPDTQQVACPGAASCTVAVTVGADRQK